MSSNFSASTIRFSNITVILHDSSITERAKWGMMTQLDKAATCVLSLWASKCEV